MSSSAKFAQGQSVTAYKMRHSSALSFHRRMEGGHMLRRSFRAACRIQFVRKTFLWPSFPPILLANIWCADFSGSSTTHHRDKECSRASSEQRTWLGMSELVMQIPKYQRSLHKLAVRDRPTQRTCICLGRSGTRGNLSICLEGGECVVLDMLNNTHSEHSHFS